MSSDLPARLREALVTSGFTYSAVADLLGPRAHEALGRNETTPALRRTTGGSPLETLVRLFLLQRPVPLAAAEQALPGLVDRMAAEGILERSVGEVAARLDCRPYAADDAELWVVSDLTPGLDGGPQRVGRDHVLGISAASTSLAQLTIREPVGAALDLGTGCGVQALHLAGHADRVVATDVNRRALDVARFNAALNELPAIEVREGSYFEPVAGERYDLIATNPPFVISPGTGERLVYRDSGLPGDRVVEHIVREAPRHLTERRVVPGARQLGDRGGPALGRAAGHLAGPGLRRAGGPARGRRPGGVRRAVAQGLRPPRGRGLPRALRHLARVVRGAGHRGDRLRLGQPPRSRPARRHTLLDWPYDVEQPIAPAIAEWAATAGLAVDLDTRLRARADLRQETVGPVGAEHPETLVLRQQRGFRRARTADTVVAGLVGACDGELTVGQILGALADLLDLDAEESRTTYLPVVRELVEEGFLLPA